MNRLEDKLTASIKPARKQAVAKAAVKKAAPALAPEPPPAPVAEATDLNSRVQPPHPRRIWPD